MKRKRAATNWEELPLLLTPQAVHEQNLLPGAGINQIYKLFKRPDFPAVRHGKRFYVARDAFRAWLFGEKR